jgi:hypothetical protein
MHLSTAYLNRFQRRLRSFLHRYILAFLPRRYERSDHPVVVVIPLAEKDIEIAAFCIESIRTNLLHEIQKIVIVGQRSDRIREWCEALGVEYIDETDVLSRDLDARLAELGLEKRSGWIKQQFLKLNVHSYIDGENYLIIDADTILVRPLAFMEGRKQIFWTADDLVEDYHVFTQSLIGCAPRRNYSFVAHCMLFQKNILKDLNQYVAETTHSSVFDAMIAALSKNESGYMSEYELYAYFILKYYPKSYSEKYWYNRKAQIRGRADFLKAIHRYKRFNFVSDHRKIAS